MPRKQNTSLSTISNQGISVREPQVALLAYDLGQQSVYSGNACAEQDAHNKLGRGIGRTKVVKWLPMLLFSTPSIRPKQVIAQPEAPRMYHIGGLALLFPWPPWSTSCAQQPPSTCQSRSSASASSTTTDRSYHIQSTRTFTELSMRCPIWYAIVPRSLPVTTKQGSTEYLLP